MVALLGPVSVSPYVIKVKKSLICPKSPKTCTFRGQPRYMIEAILHDITRLNGYVLITHFNVNQCVLRWDF